VRVIEHAPAAVSGAVRLRARVSARARRSDVVGRLGDAWKLSVHAPPERGRANDEVVRLLADRLGVARAHVRVVAGHTTRDKLVEVDGLELHEIERRLDHAGEMFDRELDDSLGDNAGQLVREIDTALARIDDGAYGTCARCGRPIPEERLEAVPYAVLCLDCKRLEEHA
jgi:RNA polymerase-binding transcription factor DksA